MQTLIAMIGRSRTRVLYVFIFTCTISGTLGITVYHFSDAGHYCTISETPGINVLRPYFVAASSSSYLFGFNSVFLSCNFSREFSQGPAISLQYRIVTDECT